MDIKSFGVICRLCMCTGTDFIDIFNVKVSNFIIADVIMECAPVTIKSNDGLPDLVCKACLHRLEMTRQFREQCLLSDSALRSFISESCQQVNSVENVDSTNEQILPYNYETSDKSDCDTPEKDDFIEMPVKVELSESDEEFQPVLLTDEELKECYKQEQLIDVEHPTGEEINECEPMDDNFDHLFACGVCSLSFASLTDLIAHQRVHQKPFRQIKKCEMCSREFKSMSVLRTHIQMVHSDGSSYKCKVCNQSFDERDEFVEHEKEHLLEELAYRCKKCNMDFYGQEGTKHRCKRKNKLECERCGRIFGSSYRKDEHKCNKRKFKCKSCGARFKLRSSFLMHQKKFGDHKCNICGVEYKSNEEYDKHSKNCSNKMQ